MKGVSLKCNKCGFENDENLKFCGNCDNKLIISAPTQISKTELEPNKDPFAKNYKKIFNICLYSVIGCIALFIFISSFRSLADFFGTILDIFLNIWIWIFMIFIFIFRKNHKAWALVVSIIFGFITIIAALGSIITF